MRHSRALAAVLLAAAASSTLCGCVTWHRLFHREPSLVCHEQPFKGNVDTRAPLRVPEGLSAPDTTGAIKVPALNTPEAVRAHNAPCLDMPPDYGTQPSGLPPQRPSPPPR